MAKTKTLHASESSDDERGVVSRPVPTPSKTRAAKKAAQAAKLAKVSLLPESSEEEESEEEVRPRSGKTAKPKVNKEEEVIEEDDSMRSESQDNDSDGDNDRPLPVKPRRFGGSSASFNRQITQDVDNKTKGPSRSRKGHRAVSSNDEQEPAVKKHKKAPAPESDESEPRAGKENRASSHSSSSSRKATVRTLGKKNESREDRFCELMRIKRVDDKSYLWKLVNRAVHYSRNFCRSVHPFIDVYAVVGYGLGLEERGKAVREGTLNNQWEKVKMYNPGLLDLLLNVLEYCRSGEHASALRAFIVKEMQWAANDARATDLNRWKGVMSHHLVLNIEDELPSRPLLPDSKAGYAHPDTAAKLTPQASHRDWKVDAEGNAVTKLEESKMWARCTALKEDEGWGHKAWMSLLYDQDLADYNEGDPLEKRYKGAFQGPFLIKVIMFIFKGPSSIDIPKPNARKSARKGNAKLHNMSMITFENILYSALIAIVCLFRVPWSESIRAFDLVKFFNKTLELMYRHRNEKKLWPKTVLQRINKIMFPNGAPSDGPSSGEEAENMDMLTDDDDTSDA